MAWNEPGSPGNKDPWGRRKVEGGSDLDQIVRRLQQKLGGLFGGRKGGGGGDPPAPAARAVLAPA